MNGAANRKARNSTSPPKPVISTSMPGSTINKIAVTRRPRTRQLRQAPSRAIAGGQDHHARGRPRSPPAWDPVAMVAVFSRVSLALATGCPRPTTSSMMLGTV